MDATPELVNGIDQPIPAGATRLLTIADAASATGISKKALARRIERGTLRAVHDDEGRRVVPRSELVRAGLLDEDGSPVQPGGAVVVWKGLYERERQEHEVSRRREKELELELAAIVNAGPFRALKLRRRLRDS